MVHNRRLIQWVQEVAELCQPESICWCNGSKEEYDLLVRQMVERGMAIPLKKRPNSFLFRSHPSDVARVEDRTFMSTTSRDDAGPTNNWITPDELKSTMPGLYRGCIRGRTMYVVPFSMGPLDSPFARFGVEITDSPYVVCNMHIMTRVGNKVLDALGSNENFVCCLHSVGAPLSPGQKDITRPSRRWNKSISATSWKKISSGPTVLATAAMLFWVKNALLCVLLHLWPGRRDGWQSTCSSFAS